MCRWLALALVALACTCQQTSGSLFDAITASATPDLSHWITQQRRALHAIPELAFEEELTSAYIRDQLTALNISFRHPVATHGIVAELGPAAASASPVVGLRADMDGLPIDEPAGLPYASTHPGKMHACGHDTHVAMLLGAAKLLKQHEDRLPGRVRLLFQPAEEGKGGARVMIQEGALEGVQAMFGMHVFPSLPSGTIATRVGTVMSASTRFTATIKGRGGHAALPHLTIDPVVAAASTIMSLQTLVSRQTSPTDSAVVSVTRVNTGSNALNVIPDQMEVAGTIRSLTWDTFNRTIARVAEVIEGTAATYGCAVDIEWSPCPYGPTVNEASATALAAHVAQQVAAASDSSSSGGGGGMPAVTAAALAEPSLAAEDFGFYAQHVPASFIILGTGTGPEGTNVSLHNPGFKMDERQLVVGAVLHASLAAEALTRLAGSGSLAGDAAQAPGQCAS